MNFNTLHLEMYMYSEHFIILTGRCQNKLLIISTTVNSGRLNSNRNALEKVF